mmetsp:Transcript_25382/g.22523  ORF Transcript_25382/g.22523 Transcript_25382/m.22523 type:complete len:113 (+) Transcript_25382:1037-1375(+)
MLNVPLTKIEKDWGTVLFFLFLIFVMQTGFVLLIYPVIPGSSKYYIWVIDIIIFFLTMTCYTIATFKDPGYLRCDPGIDFQQLLNGTDPYNLCPECLVIRTPRSRHCNICNK